MTVDTATGRTGLAPRPTNRANVGAATVIAQSREASTVFAYRPSADPMGEGTLERIDAATGAIQAAAGIALPQFGAGSPDARWYCGLELVSGADSELRCASLGTMRALAPLDLGRIDGSEGFMAYAFAWSPDGRHLYLANLDLGWIRSFALPGPRAVAAVQLPSASALWGVAEAKGLVAPAVAVAPDGRTLYLIGYRDGVWVLNAPLLQLIAHAESGIRFSSVAASPGGQVVYALADGFLSILAAADGRELQRLDVSKPACCQILKVMPLSAGHG